MKPFRLTLGGMAGWIALIGFDLAVLVRAYERGQADGGPLAVGFALILLPVNVVGLQLLRSARRLRSAPPAEWPGGGITSTLLLAVYLGLLLVPIAAILFLRPGRA